MTNMETLELEIVELIVETDKAMLVKVATAGDEPEEVWIPMSQILDEERDTKTGQILMLEIPEWLAIQKGIV